MLSIFLWMNSAKVDRLLLSRILTLNVIDLAVAALPAEWYGSEDVHSEEKHCSSQEGFGARTIE